MDTILLIIIAYISTNIDDLFINMIFFAQTRNAADTRSVIAGKYLGTGFLTLISLLGALGLQTLSSRWLSLLGVIPAALGIRELVRSLKSSNDEQASPINAKTLWLSIMITTIASGADNIGVYMPLFAAFHPWQMICTVIVFALMTGLWCMISRKLTDLPVFRNLIARTKSIVIPIVYILLGLYILL